MSHSEASPTEGQEIKSPKASQFRMEPSNLSHSLLQNPPPTSGTKRRRSSSLPESIRKRSSLLPEPAPTPTPTSTPLKTVIPESNPHCPNCGRPCWGCFSPPEVPPDVASLDEEEDIDRLRMPSVPPTPTESGTSLNTNKTTSTKKRKKHEDDGLKYVSPRDKEFEDDILAILKAQIFYKASVNFTPPDIFGQQPSTPDSRVILSKSDDQLKRIMGSFSAYLARGYDEHTLFTICADSIVPREDFIHTDLDDEEQTFTISVRRDKWKPKKNGPPMLRQIGQSIYDWDIEPDTTYAVSIQTFKSKHRKALICKENQQLIAESGAVCPYLTIEYKCTDKTGKSKYARHQVAAASILWMHQRKEIRQKLGLTLTDLRHYSITIVDHMYTFWEAYFREDKHRLRNLSHGDLTTVSGLENYIKWANAIHTWGLGENASSFKKDIETLLERPRGQQTFPTPSSTNTQQMLFSNLA